MLKSKVAGWSVLAEDNTVQLDGIVIQYKEEGWCREIGVRITEVGYVIFIVDTNTVYDVPILLEDGELDSIKDSKYLGILRMLCLQYAKSTTKHPWIKDLGC